MSNNRTIKQIYVDNYGWVHSIGKPHDNKAERIERFFKNGEMAKVEWFRKGNKEYNGKYVVTIEYDEY